MRIIVVRHRPGTGRGLVVRPDDDPPHGDLDPVLALPPVAAQPHRHAPPVHHLAAVVPADAVPRSQDEARRDERAAARAPPRLGPRPLECGLHNDRLRNVIIFLAI